MYMTPPTADMIKSRRAHRRPLRYSFAFFGAPSSAGDGGRIAWNGPPDCNLRYGPVTVGRGRRAARAEEPSMLERNMLAIEGLYLAKGDAA